jgi:hypothetical protein
MVGGRSVFFTICLHGAPFGLSSYSILGAWAPLQVKIFLWLAVRRRHWATNRRRRKGLDPAEHRFLCNQEPETIDHIIASCSFSHQVWWHIAHLGANTSRIGRGSWRRWWMGDKRRGSRLSICTCGMGTLEGEEREVLPRWLIIGLAATWPHQAIGGPVD